MRVRLDLLRATGLHQQPGLTEAYDEDVPGVQLQQQALAHAVDAVDLAVQPDAVARVESLELVLEVARHELRPRGRRRLDHLGVERLGVALLPDRQALQDVREVVIAALPVVDNRPADEILGERAEIGGGCRSWTRRGGRRRAPATGAR